MATEDLVYLFDRMGVRTGLDLTELTEAVQWLEGRLGKPLPGALLRAGAFPMADLEHPSVWEARVENEPHEQRRLPVGIRAQCS